MMQVNYAIDVRPLPTLTVSTGTYLFVLQSSGSRFGYTFLNDGTLLPTVTLESATGLILESPDTTKYSYSADEDGNIDFTTTASAADSNPQGDSPDSTTFELSAINGGFLQSTAV